jgi:hypothetical protein
VYELSAVAPGGTDAGTAWIAPARGSWRVQEGATSAVVDGATYERTGPSGGYLRRGLTRAFLGDRARLTVADAIDLYASGRHEAVVSGHRLEVTGRRELAVRLDGRPFLTLRLVRTYTRAQELFAIDPRDAATSDVELRPGAAPSVPVRAYWLGPKDGTTAFEHRAARPQDDSVTVRYRGLQVRSEPAESAQASRDLGLYRTWTARPIRLADGTRASLYTFHGGLALLAGDTLVTVLGPARASDAARLRALPAPLAPARPGAR